MTSTCRSCHRSPKAGMFRHSLFVGTCGGPRQNASPKRWLILVGEPMPTRRGLTLSRTDAVRGQPMRDQNRRDMLADAERGEIRAVDLLWIPLDQIVRTPEALNSRQDYADADLDELTASIRTHGITSPILVRPIKRAEAEEYAVVIQGRPYVP